MKREKQRIRDNGKHDSTPGRQYTYWFETTGNGPIPAPPTLHPACSLRRGDLFFHRFPGGPQFWLRQEDENGEEDIWKSVDIGYVRGDGRTLTVTEKLQRPSWVGGDWGSKRVSASGLCLVYLHVMRDLICYAIL